MKNEICILLDRFDPLDTSKLPFVRVTTTYKSWDQVTTRLGFLLKETGDSITVRYLDLRQANHKLQAGELEYVTFGNADLATAA